MTISKLIEGLPVRLARGGADPAITAVVEDSRGATPGCLFIARGGTKADGRRFIADAVRAGAAAVLTDDPASVPAGAVILQADDVALAAAFLAERFAGEPSSKLRLIGVTGTNGKTTTTYLIRHLLNRAGIRCGLIGTVQIDDGASVIPASLTTPPAVEISSLLARMVANGCDACVMETSSHALHQRRVGGLRFIGGVFTNLTGDHLDYHGTMEEYAAAKAMLFENLPRDGFAVVNIDDPTADRMIARCAVRVISCSVNERDASCVARIGRQTIRDVEVSFLGQWGGFEMRLPLVGRHNVMNALQAAAVGAAMDLDAATLAAGLSTCPAPPGRLEPVTKPDDDLTVLVDYAHTDDALRNVLSALRPLVPTGASLRVVFGCGGDRDRTKRPRMAAVAASLADDIIITSDNPRTEDPQAIIEEILTGVPGNHAAHVCAVVDRTQAIAAAIERSRPGDVVLIAGKGHEDYQIIGTTRRPFDDRLVAKAALAHHGLEPARR